MQIDPDIKLMFAHRLAEKLGILLAHQSGEEVSELPEIAFNNQAAEVYWKTKTDALLADTKSGK